jgi:pyruvate-formate lyase
LGGLWKIQFLKKPNGRILEKRSRIIMSNEEIIEEILHEASDLKIREQVLDLAKKLRDSNPKMTLLEAVELSFKHLKN